MQFLFSLEEVLDATDRAQQIGSLVRQIDRLGLVALSQFLHHLDVLLSQQIVGGIGGFANSLGDQFDSLCLSLSLTDTSLSFTFRMKDSLLLGSFSFVDDSRLLTL